MDNILEITQKILVNIINFIAPFWLALSVVIGLYFYNLRQYKHKYNRVRYKYIFEPHKINKFIFPLSLFYTFFIFSLIINIVFYFSNPNEIKFLNWFLSNLNSYFAIFFSLLIGIWALLVSYNVLKQQKTQIVSFEDFLLELTEKLYKLLNKANGEPNKRFEVFLYDYHPLIGIFSSRKRFKEYKSVLDKILNKRNIEVSFITMHQDDLADFFQKLSIDNDVMILSNSFEAVNFIKNVETIQTSATTSNLSSTIWKSKDISEYHFIIVDDTSFQYVVLPDENKGKNEIYGIQSEDPFVLDYLKKTFIEKQKSLIAPLNIVFSNNEYYIYFEPQSNIESIIIILEDDSKIVCNQDNFIPYKDNEIQGFKVNEYNLKNANSFYYIIQKKSHHLNVKTGFDNIFSVKSRKVFYRELLDSKSKSHPIKIKYIIPDIINIEELLAYCKEEIFKFFLSDSYKPLLVNVFFDSDTFRRKNLINLFDYNNIPINYISQKPETKLAIEIIYSTASNIDIEYKAKHNFKYTKISINGHSEYYFSNTHFDSNKHLQNNTKLVFENFTKLLKSLELEYSNVVRQWNYIDNITKKNYDNGNPIDNYNIFCGVRENVYKNEKLIDPKLYPVATGIGIKDTNNFTLSAIAIKNGADYKTKLLNIKSQKNPFEYSDNVLVGPNKPLFQRGIKITINKNTEYLFVSGTSSILDEKSYISYDNKFHSQIIRTVESLVELLNSDSDKTISIRNLSYLRIYYSDTQENSLNTLKTFLYPIIKDVPHIFLQTKICRDDLFVEIEGGKF